MLPTYSIRDLAASTDTPLLAVNGSDLVITRSIAAVSSATWRLSSASTDPLAILWPHGTPIAILRHLGASADIIFRGRLIQPAFHLSGKERSVTYTAVDAWHDLENEIYQTQHLFFDSDGALSAIATSRVLLYDGTPRPTVRDTIRTIILYAISIGIDLALGDIAPFPSPSPPLEEARDKTLAELIARALRWQPDALPWIDHSTSPPTFHLARAADMPELILPLGSLSSLHITPRHDIVPAGVQIRFETSNDHGRAIAAQSAGATSGLGIAKMTIPLEHDSGTAAPSQEIKVVPLGDYTSADWWRKMFPWLPAQTQINDPLILPVPAPGYDKILVSGQIQDWMRSSLDAGAYTVTCEAEFSLDGHDYSTKTLSRRFMLTNAITKRYRGRSSPAWTEDVPPNLASSYYDAVKNLQYSGSLHLYPPDLSILDALGHRLSIFGGLPSWATMLAPVMSLTFYLDTGAAQITFGPVGAASPRDMIDLVRASRTRAISNLAPFRAPPEDDPDPDDIDPFSPTDDTSASPGNLQGLTITLEE